MREQQYLYGKAVGQIMCCMAHTMVIIIYTLNILSKYGNNLGPKTNRAPQTIYYAFQDFSTHDGPIDRETITSVMQLRLQCDADLGGNLDNKHCQTSYLGYFAGFLFCWNSADQRGVSTPTPESEIEAFNRTSLRSLSAVVFSTRWVLHCN